MKKLLSFFSIGLTCLSLSTLSEAENLLQVYQQAQKSNPNLHQAQATRDIAYEKINQPRSLLLPHLSLNGSYLYQDGFRNSSGNGANSTSASLNLSQVLFDMSKWRQLTAQEKEASIEQVKFEDQEQLLLLNTAEAYFNVLRAVDALSLTESKKVAVYRQLDQTTRRFNVGLVAITDVQNARANYDNILANEVSSRNDLDNALEALREITGGYYNSLSALNVERLKVSHPEPIEQLVKKTEQKNLKLLADRLSQDLARYSIKLAQSGHMPTLNLQASSGISNTYKRAPSPNNKNDYSGNHRVGIDLNVPIYSGGETSSKVQQAQYQFVAASEKLISTQRNVLKSLRLSFNNISASISGMNAYKQAVISAKSSLNSMEAGYKVGTRTILDTLNATYSLYEAKQKLFNAYCDYLVNDLRIKYSLGTLSKADLFSINNLLEEPVSTSARMLAPELTSPKQ